MATRTLLAPPPVAPQCRNEPAQGIRCRTSPHHPGARHSVHDRNLCGSRPAAGYRCHRQGWVVVDTAGLGADPPPRSKIGSAGAWPGATTALLSIASRQLHSISKDVEPDDLANARGGTC